MANIFYYAGYDVLDEYNGGSVFAIVDYREASPKVLLFKGASKKHSYSKKIEAERPLYFCIDKDKGEMVFSSIGIYLLALRKDCITYPVKENELLEFNGSDLVTIKKYSRENCTQIKETTMIQPYYTYNPYYSRWDDFSFYDNSLSYNLLDNTYSYKGDHAQGKLCINKFGYVVQNKGVDVWFFNGVAMKDSNCFKFLAGLRKESKLSDSEFSKKFENVIRFLSVDGVYHKGDLWYKAISPIDSTLFTGTLQQLTSTVVMQCDTGVRECLRYGRDPEPPESKFLDTVKFDFQTIREKCKSLMK